jgi:hypothetical protein
MQVACAVSADQNGRSASRSGFEHIGLGVRPSRTARERLASIAGTETTLLLELVPREQENAPKALEPQHRPLRRKKISFNPVSARSMNEFTPARIRLVFRPEKLSRSCNLPHERCNSKETAQKRGFQFVFLAIYLGSV